MSLETFANAVMNVRMDALKPGTRAGNTICTPGKTVPCGKVCRKPSNCAKGKGTKERIERIGKEGLSTFTEQKRMEMDDRRRSLGEKISKRIQEKASIAAKEAQEKARQSEQSTPPTDRDARAVFEMARGKRIGEAAQKAKQKFIDDEVAKLSPKERYAAGYGQKKLYGWGYEIPKKYDVYDRPQGVADLKKVATPAPKKPVKAKSVKANTRKSKKLPSLSQISDFSPSTDRIVERDGKTFIESDLYAPIEIQPIRKRTPKGNTSKPSGELQLTDRMKEIAQMPLDKFLEQEKQELIEAGITRKPELDKLLSDSVSRHKKYSELLKTSRKDSLRDRLDSLVTKYQR